MGARHGGSYDDRYGHSRSPTSRPRRSPSTWRYDVGPKMARHEQQALPELWLVDTAADEILVYRRSTPKAPTFDVSLELAHGDTLTSPLHPDFALALDDLSGPAPPTPYARTSASAPSMSGYANV